MVIPHIPNNLVEVKDFISLFDRVLAVMGNDYVEHCSRTAYFALRLAEHQHLDSKTTREIFFASYFHDIGSIGKDYAYLTSPNYKILHSVDSYLLLRYKSPLKEAAASVLYHHCSYNRPIDNPYFALGLKISICDRLDDWFRHGIPINNVLDYIKEQSGVNFDPQDVDDILSFANDPQIVSDINENTYRLALIDYIGKVFTEDNIANDLLLMLSSLYELYDATTYNHTKTVATVAYCLGKRLGHSEEECRNLFFAGIVHDFGKIKIPMEILNKPSKLNEEEYVVMRKHIVYSREMIQDLLPKDIVDIACNHHERLDGSGYPNGLKHAQMNELQEIMQVADILSALLAKRSYKEEFSYEKTRDILLELANAGKLNAHIVNVVIENHEEIVGAANESIEAGYEEALESSKRRKSLIMSLREHLGDFGDWPLSNFANK